MPILSSLLQNIDDLSISGDVDIEISGLTLDSRACKAGYLFAAFKGVLADGRKYISLAIENGAVAILTDSEFDDEIAGVAVIRVKNPRKILGQIAKNFYGKQPEFVAAITGTNGKTSVANFCRQIWESLGEKSASMGTLGVVSKAAGLTGGESLTTPDSIKLHGILSDLAAKDVEKIALEASSHGLHQARLSGVDVKVAAFTNISRDHLDYHKTFEAYFDAKMLLFTESLASDGVAVLNADIDEYEQMKALCSASSKRVVSYGFSGDYLKLLNLTPKSSGQNVELEYGAKKYSFHVNLMGDFQVQNLLCAMAIVLQSGGGIDDVIAAVKNLQSVHGRMEKITDYNGGSILIDYAHTPDALEKALNSLRPHVSGKLIVVFGCGGDRDKGKRSLMGAVAAKFADVIIVTDDNPRNEDSSVIRSNIMEKCKSAVEVSDRRKAIEKAISLIEKGDILLVAGKGHEDYQIIGSEKIHFNDAEIIREVIGG